MNHILGLMISSVGLVVIFFVGTIYKQKSDEQLFHNYYQYFEQSYSVLVANEAYNKANNKYADSIETLEKDDFLRIVPIPPFSTNNERWKIGEKNKTVSVTHDVTINQYSEELFELCDLINENNEYELSCVDKSSYNNEITITFSKKNN